MHTSAKYTVLLWLQQQQQQGWLWLQHQQQWCWLWQLALVLKVETSAIVTTALMVQPPLTAYSSPPPPLIPLQTAVGSSLEQ